VEQSISVDLVMCPGDLAAPTSTNVVSTQGAVIAGAADDGRERGPCEGQDSAVLNE
jgi:hypothetical protein